MKKTTLTISGPNAWVEAVHKEALNLGRQVLTLRAEPATRRRGNWFENRSGRQAADSTEFLPDSTEAQESREDPEPETDRPNEEASLTGRTEAESAHAEEYPLEPPEGQEQNLNPQAIDWNPGSFASTKAALIEAETALGGVVNEAIVFIDPASHGGRFHELSLGQIEAANSIWVTGYAQLLRELGRRFNEQGSGLLLIVILPGERCPLGAMAAGAMETLACSLAAETGNPYKVFALRDESGQPDLLARYILRILDEQPRDSSKLLRHSGRLSFFGK